jgi:ATP-dependent 26S proteasome regulatory subunit
MAKAAPDAEAVKDEPVGYVSNLEYLSDEMSRLDSLIRIKVFKKRQPANPLDQFKGVVLSEEEIDGLLAASIDPLGIEDVISPDSPSKQALTQAFSHLHSQIEQRRTLSLKEKTYLPLWHLSQIFNLTRFEERCLLLCLAPEMNRKYEKLYAYLQDDITRKKPCVDLLLDLSTNDAEERLAARLAFDSHAPLLKYRLLHISDNSPDGPAPLLSRPVKLDDRIVNFLLGFKQMDERLEALARLASRREEAEPDGFLQETRSRTLSFISSYVNDAERHAQSLLLYLHGPYGSGTRSLAQAICRDLGLHLIIADVARMLSGPLAVGEALTLLGREAVLQPAALCLENMDCLLAEAEKHAAELKSLIEVTETFSRLTFLLGRRDWLPHQLLGEQAFISVEMPVPDDKQREQIWRSLFREPLADDVDMGALASKFRFTPGQIRDAFNAARVLAGWRAPSDQQVAMEDLDAACRRQSSLKIGILARKIKPRYAWQDIVLPPDQMAQIREISNQARFRHIVYGEWGFDRKLSLGKGLNALFSGPPGTGKTMAAEVIANELRLDLYKIDLSQVVSKYIGETEKNLHQIFHEAQSSGAILFFDEADALFGKRSEVKDAHDRYANIEIGYLLQKMEEYDGIAILATNLRQNMDEAFVRRMQFIIEFPFPDEEDRRRIWTVTFPTEAPLGSEVDFAVLAREIKLAGGNIKNIALAAAFDAASDGKVIRLPHIAKAARREFQKLGRTWNEIKRGGE